LRLVKNKLKLKTTLISDSHNQHRALKLNGGDLLIHAGDVSSRGSKLEILDFLAWFSEQNYTYKIFIAGNHDFFFEKEKKELINKCIPKNVIYLNDSGCIIEGVKIWGSPIQPWFYDWAFNRNRGSEIKQHWNKIPTDTEILITHGPPYRILDLTKRGEEVGCEDLLNRLNQVKPSLHIFGHIHEGYGNILKNGTSFFNASVLDLNYCLRNEPFNINYIKKN
jgi:Icc-related predicted phosphoesterase